MPIVKNGAAEIYYEVTGTGFPILTFAPKGLFSTIAVWDMPNAPIKPVYEFADEFQVITMDQRNAGGRSKAPLTADTDWLSYAQDHLAVLDDLGIEMCHLYGQCIGGPFILKLLELAPERFASAVLAQPIGRDDLPLPPRTSVFNSWADSLRGQTEVAESVFDAIYTNLYGPGFSYSVPASFLPTCKVPTLVLAGNDNAHPFSVAEKIAAMLARNELFIANWKEGEALVQARDTILNFLRSHTKI